MRNIDPIFKNGSVQRALEMGALPECRTEKIILQNDCQWRMPPPFEGIAFPEWQQATPRSLICKLQFPSFWSFGESLLHKRFCVGLQQIMELLRQQRVNPFLLSLYSQNHLLTPAADGQFLDAIVEYADDRTWEIGFRRPESILSMRPEHCLWLPIPLA